MLYNKLNEYYRYVYKYLTRKKFTLNKWLTFLPLNFYSFETQYKTLLSDLRCINITKLPIGTKEVFLCHGVSNSWYIKIPEEKQIETIAIREIVGSIFYSLFLDEKIEQHYYYEGDKAIISKEINTFTTFASHFHHILTYNVIKKEEFTESLLFNNNKCIDLGYLKQHQLIFSDFLIGKNNSYIQKVQYFFIQGLYNLIEFVLRISLEYHLNISYVTDNNSENLKYYKCDDQLKNRKIIGFERAFIASYLLHNDDLNSRNVGFISKKNEDKVIIIDYDNLGSRVFTGKTKQDLCKLIEWSRLTFWEPSSNMLHKEIQILHQRIKNTDPKVISQQIMNSLFTIREEKVVEEIFSIFKFQFINANKNFNISLHNQIESVIKDVIPRHLSQIEKFLMETHIIGESNNLECNVDG